MSFQEIVKLFERPNVETAALLCHHNADPDAVCSAYAFRSLLQRFWPHLDIQIGTPQGVSRLSKRIIMNLGLEVKTQINIEDSDIIVLLDTNTIQQLDDLSDRLKVSRAPIIVIDHHAPHPDTKKIARLYIANEEYSSTCEIVFCLYKETQIKPSEDEARALFLGIAFDTRHFIIATSSTLKAVAELTDAGVNARDTLQLLSSPMDFSERVARLKASRRVKLERIDEWIVALSHLTAYQASAARAIVELGAHVAAVAGRKDEKLDISLRSSQEFFRKTGVHLGRDIARPLGEYLHGMGGGHSTAAGVNGTGNIETALKHCLGLLKKRIAEKE